MPSDFDFIENADYIDGNPTHLSCHTGLVYVLEEVTSRPRTVTLRNVDNLDGQDPNPKLINFEDLPAGLRSELRQRDIRFRTTVGTMAAEAMG